MEKVLERALEKFDIFQRKVIEEDYPSILYQDFLMNFAGVMIPYCKIGNSFELWYEESVKDSMDTFKLILGDEVLTEEELKTYYEHTRDNYLKNFMGV